MREEKKHRGVFEKVPGSESGGSFISTSLAKGGGKRQARKALRLRFIGNVSSRCWKGRSFQNYFASLP